MEDSETDDYSDAVDPSGHAVPRPHGAEPTTASFDSASRQLATLRRGLVKGGGKMHLVLESDNGERVSVQINPEEFDFTDEDDEEYEEDYEEDDGLLGGSGIYESTLLVTPHDAAAADPRRELTPTPLTLTQDEVDAVAPTETGHGETRGAQMEPEVGVATRMVNETAAGE